MKSLADDIILAAENVTVVGALDPNAARLLLHVRDVLETPWDGNHVPLPHASLGVIYAEEATGKAVRFSFDDDVFASAWTCVQDAESMAVARKFARPPVDLGWYEWRTPNAVFGALIERSGPDGLFNIAVFYRNGETVVLGFVVPKFDFSRALEGRGQLTDLGGGVVEYAAEKFYTAADVAQLKLNKNPKEIGAATSVIVCQTLLAFIAFMNLHRAVYVELWRPPEKFQRARIRRGKIPILSRNVVSLNLPKTELTRGEIARHRESGVRRHQVIGHIRELRHGRIEPIYIWVDSFWRGDARLGVVLRDRKIGVAA